MNDNILHAKIDKIEASVHNIDITLAAQHATLQEHMKRTKLLEKFMFIVIASIFALAFASLHH